MAGRVPNGPAGRAVGVLVVALAAVPTIAAERSPVPDFAGVWARMTFGAESPPSGRGGIVNLMHRASDGAYDGLKLVGDYNDPLLKPLARTVGETLDHHAMMVASSLDLLADLRPERVAYLIDTLDGLGPPAERLCALQAELAK